MPFSYPISAASVRNRKVKDRTIHNDSISTHGRRHRETSRTIGNKSPAASLRTQSSLSVDQNTSLDQLPPLPSSRSASPSSTASPILQLGQLSSTAKGVYHLAIPPHTPACLQPYLEAEPSPALHEDSLLIDAPKDPNNTDNVHISLRSSPIQQPFLDVPPWSHSTPLPNVPENASIGSETTPPSVNLASQIPSQTSPRFYSPIPVAPRLSYLTNPQSFNSIVPWQAGYPNEQYISSSYDSQHYIMAQPNGPPANIRQLPPQSLPYYTEYGPPHPAPISFNMGRNAEMQGYGITSRLNASDHVLSGAGLGRRNSGEQGPVENMPTDRHAQEDDTVDLLNRIHNAIPDLHRLLDRYREISSQLSHQLALTHQKEEQVNETLKQKEYQIHHLGKEMEQSLHKHSAESSKLRLEIGNLEEKQRELQDVVVARKKSIDQFEATNQILYKEKEVLETRVKELSTIIEHDRSQWKEQIYAEFGEKEKKILEELQHKTEAETDLQTRLLDMNKVHSKELEEWKATSAQERIELERSYDAKRQHLETSLNIKQEQVDEYRRKEHICREDWESDRRSIIDAWSEERTKLDIMSEKQRIDMMSLHSQEKEMLRKDWSASQKISNARFEEENTNLRKEIEKLKNGWDSDRSKFTKTTNELKAAAARLDNENIGLKKMVETFGEVTDLRSRGDTFL